MRSRSASSSDRGGRSPSVSVSSATPSILPAIAALRPWSPWPTSRGRFVRARRRARASGAATRTISSSKGGKHSHSVLGWSGGLAGAAAGGLGTTAGSAPGVASSAASPAAFLRPAGGSSVPESADSGAGIPRSSIAGSLAACAPATRPRRHRCDAPRATGRSRRVRRRSSNRPADSRDCTPLLPPCCRRRSSSNLISDVELVDRVFLLALRGLVGEQLPNRPPAICMSTMTSPSGSRPNSSS